MKLLRELKDGWMVWTLMLVILALGVATYSLSERMTRFENETNREADERVAPPIVEPRLPKTQFDRDAEELVNKEIFGGKLDEPNDDPQKALVHEPFKESQNIKSDDYRNLRTLPRFDQAEADGPSARIARMEKEFSRLNKASTKSSKGGDLVVGEVANREALNASRANLKK